MADWTKKGVKGGNVDSGPGSKGSSASGRGKGPSVSMVDGGTAIHSQKASADATEKTRNADFAKGGDTAMFGEQEAAPRTGADKSPSTGKPDSSGPGEKFAAGGSGKMFAYNPAKPAQAGITSAY